MAAANRVPVEHLGIHMHSAREYNLRELGPWERDSDDLWCTVDPFDRALGQPGSVWWSSSTGLYYSGGYPIYFVGREYRDELGRAPASDEAAVGDPLEQWEENLRRFAPDEYLAYRREIARHLWF